jgi:hypothetical protein|tara:strand:- start:324 stop:581 length:258 start_codon:yes stop_codon:yes gene_type:complete
MAFTESFEYKLEIIPPYSIIQCRRADIIKKDDVEVGRSYHRTVYSPGDDISEAPQEVKDVAGALWTAELIEAYKESIESNLPITE